ncbi:MAG: hydrolase [Rhodobacteraceae bacterium PARR1]|nr:MAG: hydrolase [Rhodobacteraceae bacterium PARR1]
MDRRPGHAALRRRDHRARGADPLKPCIVFDLDDTLYPERDYNLSGLRAVGAHILATTGDARFGERCAALYQSGVREAIFDRVRAELNVATPADELVRVYRDHQPVLELHPDAKICLSLLHGRLPLGLITDGYAGVQRRKVQGLGLADRFDAIVFSDDLGRAHWKPSPLPYQTLMQQMDNRADAFVYVGDNPMKDFVTARRLGWKTVMISRPSNVHQHADCPPDHAADLEVTSLVDVPWPELGLTP